jgi:hypothetical protein
MQRFLGTNEERGDRLPSLPEVVLRDGRPGAARASTIVCTLRTEAGAPIREPSQSPSGREETGRILNPKHAEAFGTSSNSAALLWAFAVGSHRVTHKLDSNRSRLALERPNVVKERPDSRHQNQWRRLRRRNYESVLPLDGSPARSTGSFHCGRGSRSARRSKSSPPVLSSNNL